jgi:hypothetical protein
MNYIIIFFLTILQNGSFTLVSRARNSGSLVYNGLASIASNGIWYLVFRKLSLSIDDPFLGVVYVTGAVIGSVLMQWVSITYLEKKKS